MKQVNNNMKGFVTGELLWGEQCRVSRAQTTPPRFVTARGTPHTIRPTVTHRLQGFTLIEMLVGFSIFAVIALSLYVTYANGMQLNRRSQSVGERYRQAKWAMEAITRDLENIVPYHFPIEEDLHIHKVLVGESTVGNVGITTRMSGDADEQAGSFLGEEESLSFISVDAAGVKQVRYYLSEPQDILVQTTVVNEDIREQQTILSSVIAEDEEKILVREELALRDFYGDSTKEIISLHVKEGGLKFSYALRPSGALDKDLEWQDRWEGASFPVGVRVVLVLNDPQAEIPMQVQRDILVPLGAWSKK